MAADIPIVEPAEMQAGTTLLFERNLPDFPATTWTLSYSLVSDVAAPITFSASASGSGHLVTVAMGTTVNWTPGDYLMTGYVTDGIQRHEVYCSELKIKPYIAGAETLEWKSFNRKMVDLIQNMLLSKLPRDVVSYSINNRTITAKSNQELLDAYNYFKARLEQEKNAGRSRLLLTRRVSPR